VPAPSFFGVDASQLKSATSPEPPVSAPVHSTTSAEVLTVTAPLDGYPSPVTPVTVPSKVWDSEPYVTGEVTASSATVGVFAAGVATVSVRVPDVAAA
jgi:hypothetical protein